MYFFQILGDALNIGLAQNLVLLVNKFHLFYCTNLKFSWLSPLFDALVLQFVNFFRLNSIL